MESAWDRLLDLVERLAVDPDLPLGAETDAALVDLSTRAIDDRHIDIELRAPDVARWLSGLVTAHRALRDTHADVDADTELGNLLRIVTRWLHPARPR
ncbi:MAG: hypothetical protein ABWY58_14695 [Aeromicrobium sp.]